jgi:DNA-binding transcriptional ArsR family regulator
LLAILALAGASGLDDSTCFTRTYGFAYVPDLHRGVFDVLLHRARIAVQGAARLERASGRIALSATRPLLVPDPCTAQSMSDRVLRFLAEQGRASAKQAAEGLGVSLRAVQGALTALSEADACVIERQGRHVTYAIEDSVFSEPTRRLAEHGSTLVSVEGVARGG